MAALSIPEELAETIRSVVEADSVTEEERAGLDAAFVNVDSVKVLRREMDRRGQKLVVSFQGSRLVYPERIKATKVPLLHGVLLLPQLVDGTWGTTN
jgi:hypothetical protein